MTEADQIHKNPFVNKSYLIVSKNNVELSGETGTCRLTHTSNVVFENPVRGQNMHHNADRHCHCDGPLLEHQLTMFHLNSMRHSPVDCRDTVPYDGSSDPDVPCQWKQETEVGAQGFSQRIRCRRGQHPSKDVAGKHSF